MKTRTNYVSNSSSSSFVVYGNRISVKNLHELGKLIDEGKQIYCIDVGGGWSGDCGDFVFKLTRERFDAMHKKHKVVERLSDVEIISVDRIVVSGDMEEDKIIELPVLKGGCFFNYDKDYKSPFTDSVDDESFVMWAGLK